MNDMPLKWDFEEGGASQGIVDCWEDRECSYSDDVWSHLQDLHTGLCYLYYWWLVGAHRHLEANLGAFMYHHQHGRDPWSPWIWMYQKPVECSHQQQVQIKIETHFGIWKHSDHLKVLLPWYIYLHLMLLYQFQNHWRWGYCVPD